MLSFSILQWIRRSWFGLYTALWMAAVMAALLSGQGTGRRAAEAEGKEAISTLREEHASQRAQTAEESLLLYRQQVTRANQAELTLLNAQDQITDLKHQLSERIPHVSNQYRPAPGAAAVPAPRFVVTCGWLRDYNLALGASLPAPAVCRAAARSEEAAWPAPGSDAELLESGVRATDILAHARDYGAWALTNLAHLNALIDLHEKEAP
ncbi:hypothetical protein D9M68_653990 [compost metagenome]